MFCFIFIFLVYKTFFIPEKNLSLISLIPENVKVVMNINKIDNIFRKIGQEKIVSYIKLYTENDDYRARNIFSKLKKEIVWLEDANNSQILMLKTSSATLLENDIFLDKKNGEIEFLDKKIINTKFNFPEKNIFSKKDNIYFVKLNEYIFCISNDLEFLKQIIQKYDNLSKNKFKNVKNVNYLENISMLTFEIKDYDLNQSTSFVKNLSFLNKVLSDKNLKLEIDFLQNSMDVFVFKNDNFEKSKIIGGLNYYYFQDLLKDSFYYKNFSQENVEIDKQLLNYISQSVNSNVDISNEIFDSQETGIMVYKNGNFLLESADFESVSRIFRKLLSISVPDTRKFNLPDGGIAYEYFANPENINLKEYNDGNFIWYYDENIKNQKFEMVKCNDLFFVSNDKQKIINFCTNRDRTNMLFNKKQENIKRVFFVDFKNNLKIPILEKVKKIMGINFSKNNNEILFFRMFY